MITNDLDKKPLIISTKLTRSQTLVDLVLAFFTPLFQFITTVCNNNQHVPTHHSDGLISEWDVRDFVGMVCENIAHPCDTLYAYLGKAEQRGLTTSRWEKIISLLEYPILDLVKTCNDLIKARIVPASQMVLDETMLAWTADDIAVVEAPDKPITKGVKVFNVSCRLEKTNRSYCWHFMPDLGPDRIPVSVSLDLAFASLLSHHGLVITADKWFGSIAWAQAHPEARVVFNLNRNQEDSLLSLLEQGLPEGHYRVYRWSNTILSLWRNGDVFRVLSTAHSIADPALPNSLLPPATVAQRVGLPPRLKASTAVSLAVLDLPALEDLAHGFGETGGNTKADIIGRISRCRLPLPAANINGNFTIILCKLCLIILTICFVLPTRYNRGRTHVGKITRFEK